MYDEISVEGGTARVLPFTLPDGRRIAVAYCRYYYPGSCDDAYTYLEKVYVEEKDVFHCSLAVPQNAVIVAKALSDGETIESAKLRGSEFYASRMSPPPPFRRVKRAISPGDRIGLFGDTIVLEE